MSDGLAGTTRSTAEFSLSGKARVKRISDWIEARVVALIAATLHVDDADIHRDINLALDLDADSLDFVALVKAVEDGFQTDVHDEDAAEFRTVDQIIQYVTHAPAIIEAAAQRRLDGGAATNLR